MILLNQMTRYRLTEKFQNHTTNKELFRICEELTELKQQKIKHTVRKWTIAMNRHFAKKNL